MEDVALENRVVQKENPDYRILEVKPRGNNGNEVLIRYFDAKTNKYLEKIDEVIFEVPSREFIQGKHGDLTEVLWDLKARHLDIEFTFQRYNKDSVFDYLLYEQDSTSVTKEDDPLNLFSDKEEISFKRQPEEYSEYELVEGASYVIRAKMKDRSLRKTLDYMIGPKKDKQLFITNINKNKMARSVMYDSENEVKIAYKEILTDAKNTDISLDDIGIKQSKRVSGKYFVEVRCESNQLKYLDTNEFRILRFESKKYKDKKKIQKIFDEVVQLDGFKEKVEKFSLVEFTDFQYKKSYHILLSVVNNEDIVSKLQEYGITQTLSEFKEEKYITLEKNADPFHLNSPTQQLLNMFPVLTSYDPVKPLQDQINTLSKPFDYVGTKDSDLERAVNDAVDFYKENTCSIDLEVTKWLKDIIPSGRVYAAILNSSKENKLYVTKDLWKNDEWLGRLKKDLKTKWGDKVELVFLEDETELIAKLYKDSEKYMYMMMHNGKKYDFRHLIKFNDKTLSEKEIVRLKDRSVEIAEETVPIYEIDNEKAAKLLKRAEKIAKKINVSNRIKEVKEKYDIPKQNRLWKRTEQEILDTLIYSKYTWSLLADKKLSSIAGFTKSEDYDDLERKLWSPYYGDKLDVCNYTIQDGFETTIANNIVVENAVLTSLISNKPLSAVFSNNPLELFYNAGDREYELRTGTYSKRHEISYSRYKEKMQSRKPVWEIMQKQLATISQRKGVFHGKFYHPTFILSTFKDVIDSHPVARFMADKLKTTDNLLGSTDIISKINNFIRVPVDKSDSYMEQKGLVFGRTYSPLEVYDSLGEFDENAVDELFFQRKTKKLGNTQFGMWNSKTPSQALKEIEETKELLLSDNDFNQANKIFNIQYGANIVSINALSRKLNMTIPEKSSKIAEKMKQLKNHKILAYSNEFVVSEDDLGSLGYFLGDIKLINMPIGKKQRFIGKIEKDNRTYDIYQKISKPKDPLMLDLIDKALDGNLEKYDDFLPKYKQMLTDWKKKKKKVPESYTDIIASVYGLNPDKSSGTLGFEFSDAEEPVFSKEIILEDDELVEVFDLHLSKLFDIFKKRLRL